jgi:ATP synthase delta (OSCP) subunit
MMISQWRAARDAPATGPTSAVPLAQQQARVTPVADGASDIGVGLSGVAGRYASALYELASESRSVDAVSADLARIAAQI